MLKIVTLPFDDKMEEFEQEKLEKVLKDVQIVKYQAELVKIEGKYYWTAFVECEKTDKFNKNSEKEPYGILVKLNINSGKIPEKNEFLKNSAVLFALIENLSFVKYEDVSDDKIIVEFTRDEIDNYLKAEVNKNTKEIGSSEKEFVKYLNK